MIHYTSLIFNEFWRQQWTVPLHLSSVWCGFRGWDCFRVTPLPVIFTPPTTASMDPDDFTQKEGKKAFGCSQACMWPHLCDRHVVSPPLRVSSLARRASSSSLLVGVFSLELIYCTLLIYYQLLTCILFRLPHLSPPPFCTAATPSIVMCPLRLC